MPLLEPVRLAVWTARRRARRRRHRLGVAGRARRAGSDAGRSRRVPRPVVRRTGRRPRRAVRAAGCGREPAWGRRRRARSGRTAARVRSDRAGARRGTESVADVPDRDVVHRRGSRGGRRQQRRRRLRRDQATAVRAGQRGVGRDTIRGGAEITQAFVADRSRIDVVEENYPLVFGEIGGPPGDRADRGRRRRRGARSQLSREVRRTSRRRTSRCTTTTRPTDTTGDTVADEGSG